MKKIAIAPLLITLAATASLSVNAQVVPTEKDRAQLSREYTGKVYSPYAERDFATNVYFGDTRWISW